MNLLEKIMESKRVIDDAMTPRAYMGLRIIASPYVPDAIPAVQLRPDCDPQGLWCSPEYRAATNRWLLEKLGTKEIAFVMTKQQMLLISTRMQARIDRDIERLFMGVVP